MALLSIFMVLLSVYRAFLSVNVALLSVVHWALLSVERALFLRSIERTACPQEGPV